MPDDRLILLSMLACPEVRRNAGLPETGPLTLGQISAFTGIPISTLDRVTQDALRKLRRQLANLGIEPENE